ncbi:AraC family transcriptional regulator [Cohnella nanjingensis]|uniref:Helix-turn-helix transcriptional regulator n=1 Tax=Cohnella nanjingensis TaxID=1387779 RepID=A0A7X0RYE3_9BACL|nr:AraC family transcriptional regulator [Cohnella nanjingensis]MBB6674746.1 helix-turn-helix transcriptional regulator [Cohnella nanjingensis]
MNLLEFTVPPLPHYIVSGHTDFEQGHRHMSRRNVQVFDLLVVSRGCLYIGEEDRQFEVSVGESLILRPDVYHYGTEGCKEPTSYYWLHFQTTGGWTATDTLEASGYHEPIDVNSPSVQFATRSFPLQLPQYAKLLQPAKTEETLQQLVQLAPAAHLSAAKLKQQLLFQEVLQQLAACVAPERSSPATSCAEQAAAYLRSHYREEITARALGESLRFHPVYIARCMQREYGCSPTEYLLRYRIEQSKLLLMQTDYTIARIAEEVGFNQAPYFSSSFLKVEGISPRKYRQRFAQG